MAGCGSPGRSLKYSASMMERVASQKPARPMSMCDRLKNVAVRGSVEFLRSVGREHDMLAVNRSGESVAQICVQFCPPDRGIPLLRCFFGADFGADVELRDGAGSSCLHVACSQSQWTSPEAYARCLVVDCGADVDGRDGRGMTAAQRVAAEHPKDPTVLRCLVSELGADVDAADESGRTALHFAAENHDCPVVLRCLCLELGADVGAVTRDGRTALHCAVLCGTQIFNVT